MLIMNVPKSRLLTLLALVTSLALTAAVSLAVILKHHQNIRRLLAGTESRFGSKKSSVAEKSA